MNFLLCDAVEDSPNIKTLKLIAYKRLRSKTCIYVGIWCRDVPHLISILCLCTLRVLSNILLAEAKSWKSLSIQRMGTIQKRSSLSSQHLPKPLPTSSLSENTYAGLLSSWPIVYMLFRLQPGLPSSLNIRQIPPSPSRASIPLSYGSIQGRTSILILKEISRLAPRCYLNVQDTVCVTPPKC